MIDTYLVEKIIIIAINLIGFWLVFLVYFSDRRERLNWWFVAMTFFVILWINFAFLGYSADNIQSALIFYKLNWSSVILSLICAFYFFFIHFLGFKNRYKTLEQAVLFIGIVLVVLSMFTDFVIKDVVIKSWGAEIIFGYGNILFNIYSIFIGIIIIIFLVKRYFEFHKKTQKIRTKYFLFGTFLFLLSNIVFNIFFPLMSNSVIYQHFGDYSAIFFLAFTAYAIVKHELMGIKTLITQVLIVIISLILFIDVVLLSDDITMQLLKIGVLLTFLYFSRELVKSVRKEKKAREELEKTYEKINEYIKQLKKININLKEKNEDLGALLEVSNVAVGTLDSKKIAQNIMDSVPSNLKHLGYIAGILILYDKSSGLVYTYAITESSIIKKAKKLLDRPFDKHSERIDEADNLVMETIKTKEMQIGDKLEKFIYPTVNKNICNLIQKLIKAKSFVSIPIFSGGRIKGTIIFIGTKPKSKIVQRDKEILFGFSSHIGAAIENAQLYEQTEKQIKALSILNENLKMANIKLKELMEMKNEFLHITSHQLRTPLTTIRGMISMWYDGDFDNLSEIEKKKMLKRIYLSSERLNNITNDMLDSLELEGGFIKFQFKQVSLKKIVKETVDIMRPNFDEKNLYIKFDDNINVPEIEAEPNYIRQVFMNIIDNACKYTRKGGVDVDIKKDNKYLKIIIKDTGIGASKSDQEKIFQKFTRGKRASVENASGSGLGLFIAKRIVNEHNGRIEFFSEGADQGSTVKVFLLITQKK